MENWEVAIVTGIMMLLGSWLSYNAAMRSVNAQKNKIKSEAQRNDTESDVISIKAFQELVAQVQALSTELLKVKEELATLGNRYKISWRYLLESIEHMRKHDLKPLPAPIELQSDPELAVLLKERDTHDKMKPVKGNQ